MTFNSISASGHLGQVTKAIREMLEKRKSGLAKKVPVIAYYQPDFKRGEAFIWGEGTGECCPRIRASVSALRVYSYIVCLDWVLGWIDHSCFESAVYVL